MYGLWSLEVSKNRPQTLMHIICRFVKSSYNMHQCLRCILGHLQWSQFLHITLVNKKLQLLSLSVSRYNWSWLKRFWPRLNWFNPNWANSPIYIPPMLELSDVPTTLKPPNIQPRPQVSWEVFAGISVPCVTIRGEHLNGHPNFMCGRCFMNLLPKTRLWLVDQ